VTYRRCGHLGTVQVAAGYEHPAGEVGGEVCGDAAADDAIPANDKN
jgi:hypothetical protein